MREVLWVGNTLAVREDGQLCEYLLPQYGEVSTEAIYLGRVVRVISGMDAAFVDIGQEKNAYLPLKEKSKTFQATPLSPGMHVPVQIQREAHGEKGAYLTRDMTLCGEYVMLMPMNRYIGVSGRVAEEGRRAGLRRLGQRLAADRFGLVMRAAALDAAEAAVSAEVDSLWQRWQQVASALPTAHAPSLVYQPRTALDRLMDDYLPRGVDWLCSDDPAVLAAWADKCPTRATDTAEAKALRAEAEKAAAHRVWLKSGGNLVVDECEALTVIDVNTAKFAAKGDLQHTILKTNLEACREIARQLRLRNLGGIILIDLIDMDSEDNRQKVLQALTEACAADRVKTVIHGFTTLGLIEMTRRRSGKTLHEQWRAEGP